jgi:transposase
LRFWKTFNNRRNHLFFGSDAGGKRAEIIYSLTETCKGSGVDPFEYFGEIFVHIPDHPNSRLKELLAYNWKQLN